MEEVGPACEDGVIFLLNATIDPGDYPSYSLSWSDGGVGGIFSNASIEDPTWTSPDEFAGTVIFTLEVTDDDECLTECYLEVTDPCEEEPWEEEECTCSLLVLIRDEDGYPIDGAVFEVNGIQKLPQVVKQGGIT